MEDPEARMARKEREERQKSKRKEEERQKSKRKEDERGRVAVRRELQEELFLDRARESLVGFTVGSHMMDPNPLNTMTTAELERVDRKRYHIGGGAGDGSNHHQDGDGGCYGREQHLQPRTNKGDGNILVLFNLQQVYLGEP